MKNLLTLGMVLGLTLAASPAKAVFSVETLTAMVNSKAFQETSAAEAAKGFDYLSKVEFTNALNCLNCFTYNVTYLKGEDSSKSEEVMFILNLDNSSGKNVFKTTAGSVLRE